ncbi:ferritin-like domain-containing protein [Prauserella cavernicola]|uniref:Ferritin-like domain-containing protein n=1 Tax=Prauserella cavernicola TaxID=2800127 RepID=A0A934QYD9_9PSEU|nr:ferritin-like domain-containing protein [Prauserella cavernicola]MBK1788570.1 ferritin-like domain-containing protein [Prauserella cavernicola]
MTSRAPLNRRAVLRGAALAALAIPVAAAASACSGYDDSPDQLLPLLLRAEADTAAAGALAEAGGDQAELAQQVAAARSGQADALRSEVDRLNKPRPENVDAPADSVADVAALAQRLAEAREQAATLVPTLPAHRAGLVGSVAAGCAAVQQLSPELGAEQPGTVDKATTGTLTQEAVDALQQALAAEHAAVWVYGLVSAFLSADFANGLDSGAAAHRDRRDACERVLTAAGTDPRPPEPAYVPPEPVSDETSATAVVITAETDAASAWHGVLERTDDVALRTLATQALIGSATRCTSWRMEAGEQPAALALPGRA